MALQAQITKEIQNQVQEFCLPTYGQNPLLVAAQPTKCLPTYGQNGTAIRLPVARTYTAIQVLLLILNLATLICSHFLNVTTTFENCRFFLFSCFFRQRLVCNEELV
jgi:hypothetical protein